MSQKVKPKLLDFQKLLIPRGFNETVSFQSEIMFEKFYRDGHCVRIYTTLVGSGFDYSNRRAGAVRMSTCDKNKVWSGTPMVFLYPNWEGRLARQIDDFERDCGVVCVVCGDPAVNGMTDRGPVCAYHEMAVPYVTSPLPTMHFVISISRPS